jgi:hypothetical protein
MLSASSERTLRDALLRTVTHNDSIAIHLDPDPLPPGLDAGQPEINSADPDRGQKRVEQAGDIFSVALRTQSDSVRLACAGTLIAPAPPGEPDLHRGCPKTAATLVVVGRPRIITGPCAASQSVVSPSPSAEACGTIRVIVSGVSQYGVNAALFDCIYERQPRGDWHMVGRELLEYVE